MRFAKFILIVIIFSNSLFTHGQFYNGLQMSFGKNRVQYNEFYWSYYRFDRFDAYFNQFGKNLAQYTALYTNDKLVEIENFYDYKLDKRLIFIIYNKLTDFRQSNLGLISDGEGDNIGGVVKILDNKIFLYYEGDHVLLEKQIDEAITEVVLKEMLVGSNIRDRVTNLNDLNLPEWYIQGLISFTSHEWDFELENKLKDGLLSKKYKKLTKLTDEDAKIAGHSLWRYISLMYGKSIIPSIVYLTRLSKNSNKGFYNVLGVRMRHLIKDWRNYYIDIYNIDNKGREFPETGKIKKRTKKRRVYQNMKISPNGKYIVYSTNESGKYYIWLYDKEKNKHKKIFKKGYKISQTTDYSFPVISWHPSSRIITFISEEEGGLKLYFYTIDSKETLVKNFLYFDKVMDMSYSPDGLYLAISGVRNGQTDIYVHNIAASTNKQLTNDVADDLYPRFINKNKIIFSSNRVTDTIINNKDLNLEKLNPTFDLYIYDKSKQLDALTRITKDEYSNNFNAFKVDDNNYIYLSDENGIVNRYIAKVDSFISQIDTSIHYRYYTNSWPLTDYEYNILDYNYSSDNKQVNEIIYKKGRDNLFSNFLEKKHDSELTKTEYRKYFNKKIRRNDSLKVTKKNKSDDLEDFLADSIINKLQDSILFLSSEIDVNNYIFEKEKRYTFDENLSPFINIPGSEDEGELTFPQIRIYRPSFYTNYFVNQIDFGFMSTSYQPYTGSGTYFNPGLSGLFKIGTNDLFEDYKLIGGFSISPNLNSNEYLLSFENLKKRLDKQVIFHRQAIIEQFNDEKEGIYDARLKTHSHNLMFILKYPFNQVKAVKGTFNIRQDRTVYLSKDVNTLNKPNINKIWAGIKVEYIFDNTIYRGINLYEGTRYKVFGEAYKMLNEKKSDLFVIGADFRHYIRIHRELTFASRAAGSVSFGSARLLYYMGGVDNWVRFPYLEIFNRDNPVNNSENYAFQTIATNMRGYFQNIRNGNSFAIINNELRWPFVRYFAKYPISSKFLSSLQLVGFFDVGGAQGGLTKITKENGNVRVTAELNRDPIIFGYGYGIRMQLFGYFIRIDKAWGNKSIASSIIHISLSLDF